MAHPQRPRETLSAAESVHSHRPGGTLSADEHLMSPASSSSHKSVPPRSHTVQPTTNNISFPTMNPSSAGPSAAQRPKRAPTPNFPSRDGADHSPVTPVACRSRSRTPSASTWIKRVVSRSSSRASLRKQYEQIPMSEEERIEAEQVKARKAKEALAEWN
ncbi:uncharacterized protein PGTG_10745 [Puccinia graminis f. sp. tritici CRL 75-36-700-3]|uniref:Uncharacterized protein n=1 Tax=Puccinia graminis f. sp. tritici (strain CRL 75-36-700-3 / race SCCL) TaxID=418459 RepID=E3KJW1_PUCGT|nr:uncharacterized protein PGTG_10745 [Puccinia graminis f. sp. tritici CRL 75-36-700-3]EFP84586.1 hypothetical protein PGTG_10745 [Puccinia graminis f. sp. tritici CRL 75-36-700-3]